MRRYGLRDDQWGRIGDLLPGREGHVGVTAADNRGGRLCRDTVSLWLSEASAGCYGVVPLVGRCASRA